MFTRFYNLCFDTHRTGGPCLGRRNDTITETELMPTVTTHVILLKDGAALLRQHKLGQHSRHLKGNSFAQSKEPKQLPLSSCVLALFLLIYVCVFATRIHFLKGHSAHFTHRQETIRDPFCLGSTSVGEHLSMSDRLNQFPCEF